MIIGIGLCETLPFSDSNHHCPSTSKLAGANFAKKMLKISSVRVAAFSGVTMDRFVCAFIVPIPNISTECIVITYSRVWINRARLPILLVVS